ncbi:MAG TPA: histidine--tRNA ligase, partial [Saprospiraceae bacterium]|nr:histidine--tRNA ligase [Saprospiraceae bacterium]
VVMHQNELPFPFKRYQIQPVWRADRPQKGRYQEFYLCDVDVVGSKSLLYEAELVQIYDEVFAALGLPVVIRFNHRKILTGIAELCNIREHLTSMTTAIDKWDKIDESGVRLEMEKRGIPGLAIDQIISILSEETLDGLAKTLQDSKMAMQGIDEVKQVMQFLHQTTLHNSCVFDVKLARGLDYYTGCIFEVAAVEADMGSLGGGGRYDDLTSVFGMPGMPGVGISFGAERIYDVMEAKNLFPSTLTSAPQVLFIALSEEALTFAFAATTEVRRQNISADMYPEPTKLQKQMRYANQLKVPFVAIVGDDELRSQTVMLKNMESGEQKNVTLSELVRSMGHRA